MINNSELTTPEPVKESPHPPRELSAEDLRFVTEVADKFTSTRELAAPKNSSVRNGRSRPWSWVWALRGAAIIFLFLV